MKPADISMRPADWRLASIDFSAAKQLVAEQPSSSAPDPACYAALERASCLSRSKRHSFAQMVDLPANEPA